MSARFRLKNHAGRSYGCKATDASNKAADTANQGLSVLKPELAQLSDTVANLDAYKQVAETTVNFKFNSDKLDNDSKTALDQ